MYEMMGIQGRAGPTSHALAEGVVGRLVRIMKSRLRPVLNKDLNGWDEIVPMAIMTIGQLPNESLGVSPAEMVFGRALRLPQDALVYQTEPIKPQARYQEAAQAYVERLRTSSIAGKRALEHKDMEPEEVCQVGDKVAFKRDSSTTVHGSKFQKRKFHGVYLVTKVLSPTSYRVKPVHRVKGGKLEMAAHATSLKKGRGDRDNELQPTKRLRKDN
ncbi:hypothetical protein FOL47_001020 [Perkinsus chesapeaki]|uniref:Uncharacterized protein n=1 Tax=Perkinsus chesapeaki TaxID=330153 RepID=A0A7J6MK93_PERCH|nr:hypothetical protein FOL47_001020 [Perkinsus chesapeaki]